VLIKARKKASFSFPYLDYSILKIIQNVNDFNSLFFLSSENWIEEAIFFLE